MSLMLAVAEVVEAVAEDTVEAVAEDTVEAVEEDTVEVAVVQTQAAAVERLLAEWAIQMSMGAEVMLAPLRDLREIRAHEISPTIRTVRAELARPTIEAVAISTATTRPSSGTKES
jgi:hypothetical protein